MVATPGLAHAEGDEPGDPGPAATGEEQVLANETTTDGEPGSPNDAEAEAQPAVLETSGEVRESNTIQQGSSPAVVIGSSGGSHNAEDEDEARPVSRQDNSSTPITGAVQPNSPGSVPPALAGPSLMQMNVAHPPGHGGGDPATPTPPYVSPPPPPAPTGILSNMITAMSPSVEPMMSPALDPLLYLYAAFLRPQKLTTTPVTAFDLIIANWQAKLALEDLASTCAMNSAHPSCRMTMPEHAPEGAVPVLVEYWKSVMSQMSPGMEPLLAMYDILLPEMAHDMNDPNAFHPANSLESVHHKWIMKLGHESYASKMHHEDMMRSCKMNSGGGDCTEMARMSGAGGGHNHGGGGSMGDMGPMSMMVMMGMMASPKMPEMDHGDCMGGTFLMCNQGAGAETTYNDHDVMFLNHMIPHHGQAVLMSRIVLGKDDLDPRVAALAEQIKAAQGPEIRLMESWLDSWGNPPSDMVGDHGILPPKDILALRQASGADASVLFLQQMTYHHKGAVDASIGHLMGGQFDPSLKLASDIIGAQNVEIQTMSDLLASLGAPETGANVPVAPSGGQPLQPSGGGSSSGSGGHHH